MISRTHLISFADQAIFSASNFALSIGLVRVFHETEFAGYGIALSIALFSQSVQRGFNIQTSLLDTQRFSARAKDLLGGHIIILGVAILIPLSVYILLRALGAPMLTVDIAAATVACVAIYFQVDVNRIFLIKRGRQAWSLVVSSALSVVYALIIALGYLKIITFQEGMLCLAALFVVVSAAIAWGGIWPDFQRGWRELVKDLRSIMAWTTLGTLASGAYSHLPVFILGAVQAPIYTAGYVATRNLLQPLQVLIRGLDIADKHVFSGRANQDDLRRGVGWPILRNILASIVYAILIYALAETLLTRIYGEKFAAFTSALQFWSLIFVAMAPILPLESMIYEKRSVKGYSIGIVFCGVVTAVAIYPLISNWNVMGAIAGSLLGCALHLSVAIAAASQSKKSFRLWTEWYGRSAARRVARDVEIGRVS
jgi:O-antigen/teichoic acid export membrane protein